MAAPNGLLPVAPVTTSRHDAIAAPQGGTEVAARVADVLLAFTRAPQCGVSEIARDLGISKAVVHRILQSLESRQLVTRAGSSKQYRLGLGAAAIGARAFRSTDLRMAALPVLRQLREATGETTTVSALVGRRRVYLDQVRGTFEVRMMVELGTSYPLHAGASSRAILAYVPEEMRQQVLSGPHEEFTPATLTNATEITRELHQVRKRGYAASLGERDRDAGSVAAPVFDNHSGVVGSISVCGPLNRFQSHNLNRLGEEVRRGAAAISARLGCTRTPR